MIYFQSSNNKSYKQQFTESTNCDYFGIIYFVNKQIKIAKEIKQKLLLKYRLMIRQSAEKNKSHKAKSKGNNSSTMSNSKTKSNSKDKRFNISFMPDELISITKRNKSSSVKKCPIKLTNFDAQNKLTNREAKMKIKGQLKPNYQSCKYHGLKNKKRVYQHTPTLTPPLDSVRSQHQGYATIRQMEEINNKQAIRVQSMLKQFLKNNIKNESTNKITLEGRKKILLQSNRQEETEPKKLINLGEANQFKQMQQKIVILSDQLQIEQKQKLQLVIKCQKLQILLEQVKQTILEKETEITSGHIKNHQKEKEILFLKRKNQDLQIKALHLQQNNHHLEQVNQQLENKVKFIEEEKKFIKKTSQQVLKMIRKQFGQSFSELTFNPKSARVHLKEIQQSTA